MEEVKAKGIGAPKWHKGLPGDDIDDLDERIEFLKERVRMSSNRITAYKYISYILLHILRVMERDRK